MRHTEVRQRLVTCYIHCLSMYTRYKIIRALSPMPMVASFIPWAPIVHSIPVTMPVFSLFLFSPLFIFPARSLQWTSTSRSTPALRERWPTSFTHLFPLMTIKSIGSRLLSDVLAVVFPRSRSFFVVSSSGRASSSFILPPLFVWTFVAAFRLASTVVVRADW